ncbi:MAG TPA: twin-arginine translocase TatA/TatE family subunit [Methylomirabilota bacterium]
MEEDAYVRSGSKIPDLGRSLGQAIREFKKGVESPEADAETKERTDRGKDSGGSR